MRIQKNKIIEKKSGGDTLRNVEARGSLYCLPIFVYIWSFLYFFLKNGKLDFKNTEPLFNMYYKAVDRIGLQLVSISMSNLSNDSK